MPLYEYLCGSCGHRFERIRKFSDPPLTECPACGGVVEKLLSSPAIQFKGSGWYITDYAKSGTSESKPQSGGSATGAADGKASEAPAGSSSPGESKTDKPAASPTSTPPAGDKK